MAAGDAPNSEFETIWGSLALNAETLVAKNTTTIVPPQPPPPKARALWISTPSP